MACPAPCGRLRSSSCPAVLRYACRESEPQTPPGTPNASAAQPSSLQQVPKTPGRSACSEASSDEHTLPSGAVSTLSQCSAGNAHATLHGFLGDFPRIPPSPPPSPSMTHHDPYAVQPAVRPNPVGMYCTEEHQGSWGYQDYGCPYGQPPQYSQYGCSAYALGPPYCSDNDDCLAEVAWSNGAYPPTPMPGQDSSTAAYSSSVSPPGAPYWASDHVVSTRVATPPQQHAQPGLVVPANWPTAAIPQAPQAPQAFAGSSPHGRKGGGRSKANRGQHKQGSHNKNKSCKYQPVLGEAEKKANLAQQGIFRDFGVSVIVPVGGK
eukprot:TRINITY_DN23215_c0_g1_i1.p2 TRINITY_DN23215_c0_g1~~TRINITY_DN23215_c0_g1_i1.p2  ORF type:complete len:348 (+),score=80.22 TRINITY_DN23215_c0_g1_i1:82-1044(+)